jgi:hypothetical protein
MGFKIHISENVPKAVGIKNMEYMYIEILLEGSTATKK